MDRVSQDVRKIKLTITCPQCKKRAFDIKKRADEILDVDIEFKCPNCRNIVEVPLIK
jgi:ssDNA-binding Zn-finger/Zn-ribbon topoisomerase 1